MAPGKLLTLFFQRNLDLEAPGFRSGLHQDLWSVSTEGGDETQVSLPSSAFSPNGKLIAHFYRDQEGDHRFKLAIMSAEDRSVVRVVKVADDKARPLGIDWSAAWSGDNKNFYYITTDGSRNSLWCQSLEDPNPRLVGDLGNEEIAHFAVSAEGTSVAFIRGRWVYDAVLIEGLK